MTQEHPLFPPSELMQEWSCDCPLTDPFNRELYVATLAARWGADQELEACLDEIYKGVGLRLISYGSHRELLCSDLRAARRPKPPSLKKQALESLKNIDDACESEGFSRSDDTDIIRRALEMLPE